MALILTLVLTTNLPETSTTNCCQCKSANLLHYKPMCVGSDTDLSTSWCLFYHYKISKSFQAVIISIKTSTCLVYSPFNIITYLSIISNAKLKLTWDTVLLGRSADNWSACKSSSCLAIAFTLQICDAKCKLVLFTNFSTKYTITATYYWVVEFIARWCHVFYKLVQHTFNRCVQNNKVSKCTKNHANWIRNFEGLDTQTVAPSFWPTL